MPDSWFPVLKTFVPSFYTKGIAPVCKSVNSMIVFIIILFS